MESGGGEWLPGEAEAGTELVLADVGPILIVAQAAAENKPIGDPPLVLDIEARRVAELLAGIEDRERSIDRSAGDDRQERIGVGDIAQIGAQQQAAAQRVRLVEAIGDVGGDAVGDIGAKHVRGHAVEDDIADRVGDKVNAAVAREIGELHVGAIDRALQRGDPVIALLELVLVEIRGIEGGDAVGGEVRHLAGGVGYLVAAVGGAGHESEPRVGIEQGRDIAETPLLRGMVMNCVPVRRRYFPARYRSGSNVR